jgi:hypothetical protein
MTLEPLIVSNAAEIKSEIMETGKKKSYLR